MSQDFLTLPDASSYVLCNGTIPVATVPGYSAASVEGLVAADIVIADGRIDAIVAPGTGPRDIAQVDMRDGMIWPCFVDMHTHLDKGHIWPRQPNPDGTFDGALSTVGADRIAHWTAEDIAARMDFALRASYAHGTKIVRTHLDSLPPHHKLTWPVFAEMRDKWKGRIELQAAALFSFDMMDDLPFFYELVAEVAAHDGVLGGVTFMVPELENKLDIFFKAAADNGLDVDLHVDETADPGAKTLRAVAEAVLRNNFAGKVVVGHCCSLAMQDKDEAAETIEKIAQAKLDVVSLPMCNMYLQGRKGDSTPHWRGVTLVHELMAAGVNVSVASDNTRDPFYAYGDLDMVEVYREAVRILHLDHPLDEAAQLVTVNPAQAIGRATLGQVAVGDPADLVLFNARNWSEFLSRPQADRTVLRDGVAIDRTLPDYRELDAILGV